MTYLATKWRHGRTATKWRIDAAMCASAWTALAATRRHDVAMGASPWIGCPIVTESPDGATGSTAAVSISDWFGSYVAMRSRPVAPLGLRGRLRPVSTGSRPWLQHVVPLGLRMQRMTAELYECLLEAESLDAQIKSNLKGLGYAQ